MFTKNFFLLLLAGILVATSMLIAANKVLAASVVPLITHDLTVGSAGDEVKALQQYLNYSGYTVATSGPGSAGSETSSFGGLTKAALMKFQTAKVVSATGVLDNTTRALLDRLAGRPSGSSVTTSTTTPTTTSSTSSTDATTASLSAEIATLKAQISSLQTQITSPSSQIATLTTKVNGSGSSNSSTVASSVLSISAIKVSNGGEDGYVDKDDYITITFNTAIDPGSIDSDLDEGGSVIGVSYSETGGVSISSAGKVTVKNIATFDLGSVSDSGNFTVKLALNSTGKILTITLTSGSEIEIITEDFGDATQIGGTVENEDGDEMGSDTSIDDPSGTFGGENGGNGGGDGPSITDITVYNGGDDDYIDAGDSIKIVFDKAIDPESVNSKLKDGGYITGVKYSENGGISISSTGKITIKGIATFDVGSVAEPGSFSVKLSLNSSGKELTIALTTGDEISITSEDFSDATQVGGTVEDEDGNEMSSDSRIDDPTGTFSD